MWLWVRAKTRSHPPFLRQGLSLVRSLTSPNRPDWLMSKDLLGFASPSLGLYTHASPAGFVHVLISGTHIWVMRTLWTPTVLYCSHLLTCLPVWWLQENRLPVSSGQLLASCLKAPISKVSELCTVLWLRGISLTLSYLDFALLKRVHGPLKTCGVSAVPSPNCSPAQLPSFSPSETSREKNTHFPFFHGYLKFCLGFSFAIFSLLTDWVMFFISVNPVLACARHSVAKSFCVFLTFGCCFQSWSFHLFIFRASVYVLPLKSAHGCSLNMFVASAPNSARCIVSSLASLVVFCYKLRTSYVEKFWAMSQIFVY